MPRPRAEPAAGAGSSTISFTGVPAARARATVSAVPPRPILVHTATSRSAPVAICRFRSVYPHRRPSGPGVDAALAADEEGVPELTRDQVAGRGSDAG